MPLPRIDSLTAVLAIPLLAALPLSLLSLRPNRIAPPAPRPLAEVLGPLPAALVAGAAILLVGLLLVERRPALRVALLAVALAGHVVLLGSAASRVLDAAAPTARAAPGPGFWLAFLALALLLADAIARLRPSTGAKAGLLVSLLVIIALLSGSGLLADLSIAAEFRNRDEAFAQAVRDHLTLAFGSFLAALAVGLPIGIAVHQRPALRGPVLSLLTLIQTIPSIALFGMLILPLAWIAAHVPGATALGISGIGMAPALIALFLYALLPIVGNTVAGLDGVPRAVTEAASGMGMTTGQRLRMVDLPLAMPVILTGARIVLVQNIGLATVGALIGSGGFGTFIFQGIGQTAADLILLGVLPTVALALLASSIMDLLIALSQRQPA